MQSDVVNAQSKSLLTLIHIALEAHGLVKLYYADANIKAT